MTNFDTSQFERARQAGAQLGMQQFGVLEQLAENRRQARLQQEELQQRAQQIQFGQALDLRQQDLAEARESRLAEAFQLDQKRAAWEFEQAQQEAARRKNVAGAYGTLLLGQLERTDREKETRDTQAAAVGAIGQIPNPIKDAIGKQKEADTKILRRMIRQAMEDGSVELMPVLADSVDDEETRAREMQRTRWALELVHNDPQMIAEPGRRAMAEYYIKTKQFDLIHRMAEENQKFQRDKEMEGVKQQGRVDLEREKQQGKGTTQSNQVASIYESMAANFAKRKTGEMMKPDQQSQYQRAMEAAAAAKMNPASVLQDGSVVLNNGVPGRDGFIRVVHPDGSEEGLSPAEFAAKIAPQMMQQAQQPEQPAGRDVQAEAEAIIDRMSAENATDEEIAAELQKAGITIGE